MGLDGSKSPKVVEIASTVEPGRSGVAATVDIAGAAVAQTLRAERAAAGLSQAELAERSGIPRPTYLRYERGDRQPTLVQTIQLAQALGITLKTFAARVEDRIRATRNPEPRTETERPVSMQELKRQRLQAAAMPVEEAADNRPSMEPDDDGEPR